MVPQPWEQPLPLSLVPQQGESLRGYLLALSSRLDVSPADLAHRIGLTDRPDRIRSSYAEHVPADVATRMSLATGLSEHEIAALTLSQFDDASPAREKGSAWQTTSGRVWAPANRTRYCPHCLHDDQARGAAPAWHLAWQTAWSFACTRHAILLSDQCPACSAVVGGSGREQSSLVSAAFYAASSTACRVTAGSGICGEDLAGEAARGAALDLSSPDWSKVIEAQARLDTLLAAAGSPLGDQPVTSLGRPVDRHAYLGDVRVLAVLLHLALTAGDSVALGLLDGLPGTIDGVMRGHRGSGAGGGAWALPLPATLGNALLLAAAVRCLDLDPPEAARTMGPVVRAATEADPRLVNRIRFHWPASPRLQNLIAPSTRGQLDTRMLTKNAAGINLHTLRPESIPALLPLRDYDDRFRWVPDSPVRVRRTIAVCLYKLAAECTPEEAAAALGIADGGARMTTVRVMRALSAPGDLARFRSQITELAEDWASNDDRPDYAATRAALHAWCIPEQDWQRLIEHSMIGTACGPAVDWPGRIRPASAYVWARRTEGETIYSPLVLTESAIAREDRLLSRLREMLRAKRLRADLDAYADAFVSDAPARIR